MDWLKGQQIVRRVSEVRMPSGIKDTQDFIQTSKQVHGDRYDYSKTEYNGIKNKVVITCAIHGDFRQPAHYHLKGKNCFQCAADDRGKNKRKGFEAFKQEAIKIHNGIYSYKEQEYKDNKTSIIVTCSKHGDWTTTANNHISKKSGCPICHFENGAYNYKHRCYNPEFASKDGCLYLLKLTKDGESFGKVGVSINYNLRFRNFINKGFEVQEIDAWKLTAGETSILEETILDYIWKEGLRFMPSSKFDGSTECFNLDYVNEIIEVFHINHPRKRCEEETYWLDSGEIIEYNNDYTEEEESPDVYYTWTRSSDKFKLSR